MNAFVLPTKNPAESITVNVPFADVLGNGEIVVSAVVTISVYSGTDPTPSNVLLGVPTTDPTNTIIIFTLVAGIPGTIYLVLVQATGSSSNVPIKIGYLAIVPDDPFATSVGGS